MQLVPVNTARPLFVSGVARWKERRAEARMAKERGGGARQSRVLALVGEFIDAEFEEMGWDRRGGSLARYWAMLFPEFFFKCRYVNYYI